MYTRRHILTLLAAAPVAASFARAAHAASPMIFQTDGIAINGYDPVAYFTQAKPVEGTRDITSVYKGASFQFSSAANKATFEADPEAYAPQYGGYCAYGVSKGGIFTTNPAAWTVADGKLYLNYSKVVRGIWKRDIPGHVRKANANWPAVLA